MEQQQQRAPSFFFQVFLIVFSIPSVFLFVLLCLVRATLWLNSFVRYDHVSTTTTNTTAQPKEDPSLSAGKEEISDLNADTVRDQDIFESLWDQEDVAASLQEADVRDVGSDEEETSEDEIEAMDDEVNDFSDEDDDDHHDEDEYENDDNEEDDVDEYDDWEVLERRKLRTEYERAVRFVESQKNDEGMSKLSDHEKLRFYGLHKVAVEGPCQEPQPAPFNLSAHAKWNAWQRLGFMSPDDAVSKYIDLLQEKFPNWQKDSLVVTTSGDQDRRIILEATSESSPDTMDHGRSRTSIDNICSLLSFIKYLRLAMNKLGKISFHKGKMSGEGNQSSEMEIRRP